ncbi:MAG: hypothetical protein Kow0059_11750 [Candidatus Sumerlaeia bacterium]
MISRPGVWCLLLCLLLYGLTSSGRLGTWDADLYYAVTERLVTAGRLDVPEELVIGHPEWRGRGGRFYAPFDLGQSLANVPFYLIGRGAARVLSSSAREPQARRQTIEYLVPRGVVAMSNALWMALAVAAVGGIAGALGWGRRDQAAAMLLTGLATMAWPYATVGFNQALATLGQTAALLGAVRWARRRRCADAWLTGGGMALGLLARLNTVLALPGLLIVALGNGRSDRSSLNGERTSRPAGSPPARGVSPLCNQIRGGLATLSGFIVPVIPALVLAGLHNWIRFESVFCGGYHGDANTALSLANLPRNFYLLTLSPAKGIVWYSPIVVLAGFGAWRARRQAWVQGAAVVAAAYLVFFSLMNYGHSGVHSWGPRFLVPVMPLVGLLAVEGWRSAGADRRRGARVLAGALVALSVFIQVLAVSSDQSERVAAMEERWRQTSRFIAADSSPVTASRGTAAAGDYYTASWTRPSLSPISDRAEVFVHKLARGQGLGLAAGPTVFFRRQHPRALFYPSEAEMGRVKPIPPRHKTLILRYRWCFDFWWCYATAIGLWPRWMGVAVPVLAAVALGIILLGLRMAVVRKDRSAPLRSCATPRIP